MASRRRRQYNVNADRVVRLPAERCLASDGNRIWLSPKRLDIREVLAAAPANQARQRHHACAHYSFFGSGEGSTRALPPHLTSSTTFPRLRSLTTGSPECDREHVAGKPTCRSKDGCPPKPKRGRTPYQSTLRPSISGDTEC